MFGSTVLEVAIGVVFVYLVLSLLCTAINEWFATLINKRGSNLFEGVKNLLNDPDFTGLAQQLYGHGLVDGITQFASDEKKMNRWPSYMPPENFSLALLDILGIHGNVAPVRLDADAMQNAIRAYDDPGKDPAGKNNDPIAAALAAYSTVPPSAALEAAIKMALAQHAAEKASLAQGNDRLKAVSAASKTLEHALAAGRALVGDTPSTLAHIQQGVLSLPEGNTRESLLVMIDKARRELKAGEDEVTKLKDNIERWFDDSMNRVSGWYKRWTQKVLLVIGICVVIVVNADTVMLVQRFTRDSALRASLVSTAENVATLPRPASASSADTLRPILDQAKELQLPLGWSLQPKDETHVPWAFPHSTTAWEILREWILKVLGLLITVIAISLGAPFWFDTLSKLVNLRGSGTPPGDTKKSAAQPKQATH